MPNANFVPLIGSSFDQLGQQQLAWAGFNRGVEEGNINRAARAEETQGNWMAQAAAAQQAAHERDIQRQLDRDASDRQMALQARAESTRKTERAQDISLGLGQEARQTALTRESWRAQADIAGKKLDLLQKQQELAIDQRGQTFAQQYAVVNKQKDLADEQVKSMMEKQSALQKEKEKLDTKARKKGFLGMGGGINAEEQARMLALDHELSQFKTLLPSAQRAKSVAESASARLEAMMTGHGYVADPDAGHVRHLDTGKTWNFKRMVQEAATASDSPAADDSTTDASVWPGFTQATGTNAPVAAAASPPVTAAGKRWRWDATQQQLVPVQ